MFDVIANLPPPEDTTFAERLAALYAEPEDAHRTVSAPTLEGLTASLALACGDHQFEFAIALAAEVNRLTGVRHEAQPGFLHGAKTGLWRVQ